MSNGTGIGLIFHRPGAHAARATGHAAGEYYLNAIPSASGNWGR
jgi:hypothetical protein